MCNNPESPKRCFIITPIGDENSDLRKKIDGVIDVLREVLEKKGFNLIVPHEISTLGSITNQIIIHLLCDDLVIANLTGLNPNVMYELAVRHNTGLPIITIAEKGTKLPFDIQDDRMINYTNSLDGVAPLKRSIGDCLNDINFSLKYQDNPILRAKSNRQREKSLLQMLGELHKINNIGDLEIFYEQLKNHPFKFEYYD